MSQKKAAPRSRTVKPKRLTDQYIQAELAKVAKELGTLAKRLEVLCSGVPSSTAREAMLDHKRPRDLTTALLGRMQCVRVDFLEAARESLEELSALTKADLIKEFTTQRKRVEQSEWHQADDTTGASK
jgi:hypothetical protein